MNVYDQAHSLATAVKESEEYKQFQARKKDIEGNPELEKALNDFLKQQFEMQAAQAMGQPMDPEALGKLQQFSGMYLYHSAIAYSIRRPSHIRICSCTLCRTLRYCRCSRGSSAPCAALGSMTVCWRSCVCNAYNCCK